MNAIALAAAVVHFTLPSTRCDSASCLGVTEPLRNPALVQLMARPVGTYADTIVASHALSALTIGLPDSLSFNTRNKSWWVWVVVTDSTGMKSCPSEIAGINLPADVPREGRVALSIRPSGNPVHGAVELMIEVPGTADVAVFDVAGRRVDGATGVRSGPWRPRRLAAGIYLAKVRGEGSEAVARFAVVD